MSSRNNAIRKMFTLQVESTKFKEYTQHVRCTVHARDLYCYNSSWTTRIRPIEKKNRNENRHFGNGQTYNYIKRRLLKNADDRNFCCVNCTVDSLLLFVLRIIFHKTGKNSSETCNVRFYDF